MQNGLKSIVAFGVLAMIAASANASVVINVPALDGYSTGNGTAVINRAELGDFTKFIGAGPSSSYGSFTFMSTINTIIKIDAQVKTNGVSDGSIDAFGMVMAGPSVLFRSATEVGGVGENQMNTAYQTTTVSLAANTLYTMDWGVNYLGFSPGSYGYVTQAVFIFTESGTNPVPEPTSMAAVGIGLAGLLARRRKGAK